MKIKKGKIFCNLIYVIIGLILVYNIIFSINTAVFQNDYLKLFGISLFNMETNLMKEDISKNDLVIVKEAKENKLQAGDIIAYTINGKIRINKIVRQEKGEYTTKSNENYNPDIEKITYNQIVGKVEKSIPFFGKVILILQSRIITVIILIVLILCFLRNKYVFIKKQERARKKNRIT